LLVTGLVLVVVIFAYRWWPAGAARRTGAVAETTRVSPRPPKLSSDRLETPPPDRHATEPAPPAHPEPKVERNAPPPPEAEQQKRLETLIEAGRQALAANDPLTARARWSEALKLGPPGAVAANLRSELTRVGAQTILSNTVLKGDPLTELYVVKAGDTLGRIAKGQHITAELLQRINNLSDKHTIRIGQTLKIVHGPFHAVVRKSTYSLDVYCQDAYVHSFPVALGADDSTPTGLWKVSGKLVNPTWYPPRGGDIVLADDPKNPLGERWIGLAGIDGQAVGQPKYGIHGTIEPDSIGKSVSLGCIRMRNEDVELLYDLLVEELSQVRVED
jgi:LysM repeat protein